MFIKGRNNIIACVYSTSYHQRKILHAALRGEHGKVIILIYRGGLGAREWGGTCYQPHRWKQALSQTAAPPGPHRERVLCVTGSRCAGQHVGEGVLQCVQGQGCRKPYETISGLNPQHLLGRGLPEQPTPQISDIRIQ